MVLRSGSAAQYMRHSAAADDDNDFEAEEADRMMRAADAEAASKNSKDNSRPNHQRAGSLVNSNRLGVKSNHF